MRIVFMGTPDFAVPSLQTLLASSHEIAAVVTGPDKLGGRGLHVLESAVKKYCRDYLFPVLQPENLKDGIFIRQLQALSADLFVVVAFRILPEVVFSMPPKGTINLHASLLPLYRGAAPINWAIINGEHQTGVTTFFIEKTVDTGKIILQRSVTIEPNDTAGVIHDKLAEIGAQVLLETVNLIASGQVQQKDQTGRASAAPKITAEMCRIRWSEPALSIHNLIRGLAPYPGAFTTWQGKILKVFQTQVTAPYRSGKIPGQIIKADPVHGLRVATGAGEINLLKIQLEGRRSMTVAEFLRGHLMAIGDVLGAV